MPRPVLGSGKPGIKGSGERKAIAIQCDHCCNRRNINYDGHLCQSGSLQKTRQHTPTRVIRESLKLDSSLWLGPGAGRERDIERM